MHTVSLELLARVEQAEAAAEERRASAQKEAREILKGVEEATLAMGRAAGLANRELAAEVLNAARAEAQRQIEAKQKAEAAEHEALRALAAQKLANASSIIFERVVNDGHR